MINVEIKDNSNKIRAGFEKGMEAALIKVGEAGRDNVRNIVEAKHIYDTGELYRTIGFNIRKPTVDVGSPKNYAVYQELGTRYISPRPFIQPGIMDNIEQYKSIIADTIKSSIG